MRAMSARKSRRKRGPTSDDATARTAPTKRLQVFPSNETWAGSPSEQPGVGVGFVMGFMPTRRTPGYSLQELRRADQRKDFTLVPAIDSKVPDVHGDDAVTGVELAHPDQTQIGKVRPSLRVARGQGGHLREVLLEVESELNESTFEHRQDLGGACQM